MISLRNDTEAALFHEKTMTGFPVSELVDCSLFKADEIDEQLITWIQNGSLVFNDGMSDRSPNTGVALLENRGLSSSCAVDMNGLDQNITNGDPTHISQARVIWDLNGDFDDDTGNFIVPFDGVYSHDAGVRLVSLVNVEKATLALYKGEDYWFTIDEKPIPSGATEIYLTNSVHFDMYEGEEFDLKVILTSSGGTPTATIDGDDDFTAWGFDLSHVF